jgi:hypothetical protein
MKMHYFRNRTNAICNCEQLEARRATMAISKTVSSFVWASPKWTIATILSFVILLIYYQLVLRLRRAKLPVYSNHTGLFASWYDALDYVWDSPGVLKRGYDKVRRPSSLAKEITLTDYAQYSRHGHFFQLRTPARWVIVVPPRFIEEVRTAAPNQLSARVAANDVSLHSTGSYDASLLMMGLGSTSQIHHQSHIRGAQIPFQCHQNALDSEPGTQD